MEIDSHSMAAIAWVWLGIWVPFPIHGDINCEINIQNKIWKTTIISMWNDRYMMVSPYWCQFAAGYTHIYIYMDFHCTKWSNMHQLQYKFLFSGLSDSETMQLMHEVCLEEVLAEDSCLFLSSGLSSKIEIFIPEIGDGSQPLAERLGRKRVRRNNTWES